MKRLMLCGFMCSLVLAWAALAMGEGIPWQGKPGDAADKPAGEAAKPAVDLEKELPPLLYGRAIRPILLARDAALKQEDLYNKEMEKPDDKRDTKRAVGFKEHAAKGYLAASIKAKQAVAIVPEKPQKDAVVAQYEKPMRNKAVETNLWLADQAAKEHDLRTAVGYYLRVLPTAPENATAKEQIEKIKKDVEQAIADRKAGKNTGGGGGGSDSKMDFTGKDQRDPVPGTERPDREQPDWKKKGGLR